jgi:predicted DNA-binding WGR domain protein
MARFYAMSVQPDLFGQWFFMREWGRIGRGGQMRETPYPSPADAEAALEPQRHAKERRGYSLLSPCPLFDAPQAVEIFTGRPSSRHHQDGSELDEGEAVGRERWATRQRPQYPL